MPIKIKIVNIENQLSDSPEPGYMYLGFDDAGNLMQKDSDGNARNVVQSTAGGDFQSLKVKYLTVGGFRTEDDVDEGNYTIAQGTTISAPGDTAFVRGRNSYAIGNFSYASGEYATSNGEYSFANGQYVTASGLSSYVWGRGTSTLSRLVSDGINSFVHQYATIGRGTGSDYSVILGGYDHDIGYYSDSAVILGGNNNTIGTSTSGSTIIGGRDNIITNSSVDVVYIGRSSLINPPYNYTTYVTKLSLDTNPPSFGGSPTVDGVIWYESGDIKARVNGVTKSIVSQDTSTFVTTGTTQTITGQKTFNSVTFNTNNINISGINIEFSTNNNGIITADGDESSGVNFKIKTGTGGISESLTNPGGNINIETGKGGDVTFGTAGNGGEISILGGNGGSSAGGGGIQGKGGNVIISGGMGGTYSTYGNRGGTVTISGGTSYYTNGGNVEIYGGKNLPNGVGGDIIICTPSDYMTGDIFIKTSNGAYSGGDIVLSPGTGPSNNGSVFIGTGTPNNIYKLHVSGATLVDDLLFSYKNTNGAQYIGNWNSSNNWGIGGDGASTSSVLKIETTNHLGTWQGGDVNMQLTGNLQISNGLTNMGSSKNIYWKYTNSTYSLTRNVTDTVTPYWSTNTITGLPNTTDKVVYITIFANTYRVLVTGLKVYAVTDTGTEWYFINYSATRMVNDILIVARSPIQLTIIVPSRYSDIHVDLYVDSNGAAGQTYGINYWVWKLGNWSAT